MMLEDADLAHDRGEALGLLGRGVDERKANSADGEADELADPADSAVAEEVE